MKINETLSSSLPSTSSILDHVLILLTDVKKDIPREDIDHLFISLNIQPKSITSEQIDDDTCKIYSHINFSVAYNIHIPNDQFIIDQILSLHNKIMPRHNDQLIKVFRSFNNNHFICQEIKPHDQIIYDVPYDSLMILDYERRKGAEGMIFQRLDVIDKQRDVASYFMKKIGSNLFLGKSIMNISLPINIFDGRSLLEQWVWQNGLAYTLLEQGGKENCNIEKIKYSTAFALSKFFLSGAQLKPFNPTIGETFQAKLGKSMFYIEQSNHKPPICNFYGLGEHYKIYGYEQSEASTGVNTVTIYYKGQLNIQYEDGTKHLIIYPTINLEGTMFGARILKFKGNLSVIDIEHDMIGHVSIDPDRRSMLTKMLSDKNSYPDYFKGTITSLSKNTNWSTHGYDCTVTNRKSHILSTIEGEFTREIRFNDVCYYKYTVGVFPKIYRNDYTLPSDSTLREDIFFLKQKEEDLSQKYKVRIEDIQRYDEKLKKEYGNGIKNESNSDII